MAEETTKILLIDHDPGFAQAVRDMLASEQHIVASDGLQGSRRSVASLGADNFNQQPGGDQRLQNLAAEQRSGGRSSSVKN